MPTLDNPSFETADPANSGLAQSWTLSTIASVTIAGYALGGGIERAWETFEEGWVTPFDFDLAASTTTALYSSLLFVTPQTFEGFDVGWAADQAFNTELGATTAAEYGTALAAFDTFETEWGFTGFSTSLAASLTTAQYGSALAAFDTFSVEWFGGTYESTLAGATTPAAYNAGADAFEAFENVFTPVPFTTDPTTNTFTAPSHGLSNGKRVLVETTGQLPSGLSTENYYFVIGATTNTFQLSGTSGGSAIDVTTPGSGTNTVISDGLTEWNLVSL